MLQGIFPFLSLSFFFFVPSLLVFPPLRGKRAGAQPSSSSASFGALVEKENPCGVSLLSPALQGF